MSTIIKSQNALIDSINQYCATPASSKPLLIWFERGKLSNPLLDSFKNVLLGGNQSFEQVNESGVVTSTNASCILYHRYVCQMDISFLEDSIQTRLLTKKPVIVFANDYEKPNRPDMVSDTFEEVFYRPPFRVALVACSSTKQKNVVNQIPAELLYTSQLFKKAWAYADRIGVDAKYILSDKYGLLSSDSLIEEYDVDLRKLPHHDKVAWGEGIISELINMGYDLHYDIFVLLAGQAYCTLLGGLKNREEVYKINKLHGIGQILHFLKNYPTDK